MLYGYEQKDRGKDYLKAGSPRAMIMENVRFQNEEFHSLYCVPNAVSVIKSKRLRWTGHVARAKEARSSFIVLTGKNSKGNYRKI